MSKIRQAGWFGLLAGALLLSACDDDDSLGIEIVRVALTPDTATLQVGATQQMTVAVRGVDDESVTFSSSDTTVATVDSTGLVTALSPGQTLIRAVSNVDQAARDSSLITVQNIVLSMAPDTATLTAGDTLTLTATSNTLTPIPIDFATSDSSVATVDATGLVTAVAAGTAVITVTTPADTTARDSTVITVVAGASAALPHGAPSVLTGSAPAVVRAAWRAAAPVGTLALRLRKVRRAA